MVDQVTMDADSDFFLSGNIEIHELGDDEFVPAGSAGTGKTKKKGKSTKKLEKLVDVGVLRLQFNQKLTTQFRFCKEALTQAIALTAKFKMEHGSLWGQFLSLVSHGIMEDAILRSIVHWLGNVRGQFHRAGDCDAAERPGRLRRCSEVLLPFDIPLQHLQASPGSGALRLQP